ncbi:hypothetical protein FCV25MIE_34509 [Fagus crenata]
MSNTGFWRTSTSEREIRIQAPINHELRSGPDMISHRFWIWVGFDRRSKLRTTTSSDLGRHRFLIESGSGPASIADPSSNSRSKLRSTTSSTSSPTAPPSTTSSDPSSSPTAALNHELADRPVERRIACFAV